MQNIVIWIADRPTWAIYTLVPLAWILLGVALAIVGRWIFRDDRRAHVGKASAAAIGLFNATYGILVAFTIVTAWAEYTSVQKSVTAEASTLSRIYLSSESLDRADKSEVRAAVREYAASVIDNEADALSERSGTLPANSGSRLAHLVRVSQLADEHHPGLNLGAQASSIIDSRRSRFDESRRLVPSGIYVTVLISGLLVLALMTWFDVADTRIHLVVIVAAALLIGLTQATVIWLDDPYAGDGPGISYKPFESVLFGAEQPRA